ncbi:Crp/Fnr family transcriptional regulator [Limibacter armeniacum]|uniref:Crp/Fnr family transcriptional regulator n=1 Tax=Limibacter armeniacum TaxID=466084 RepID=UPI002FE5376B
MMKAKLEETLRSLNILTAEEISEGLKNFDLVTVKRNEILMEAGKTCDWIAFVNSGILRNYYISSKGEEVTYCLTFPKKLITACSSFITQEKTFENIHAITDAELLVIRKNQFSALIESSNNWLRFSNYFYEQSYILMENRLLALQMESAEKRYEDLINNHPNYLQEVPLKYIASYLGITQRHLSRLRKNISF